MALRPVSFVLLVLLLAGSPVMAQNKEKVFRKMVPAKLEALLTELDIQYKKTPHNSLPDVFFYDFVRMGYKLRLANHGGRTLWLDCLFPRTSLETVNKWNIRAKFSRAVLQNINAMDTAIVETQLDVTGGATLTTVRQFIRRFDEEVSEFDKFLKNN